MKSFLIIGMGSFGHHLCQILAEQKCEIMIVDENSECVEDCLKYGVSAKIGDCTNPDVLRTLGVENFDTCFVCIGTNFQNSLEITNLLKELGAKRVLSKAERDIQAKFLLRNGADEVIYPEKDVAYKVAINESMDSIFDCIQLTDEYSILEIGILPKWEGNSIKNINFRAQYHISILATKKGERIMPMPTADYIFNKEEHLIVLGRIEDIQKIVK